MVEEKIKQAASILRENNIDVWMTFVRESSTLPDPALELILGTHCTWESALILTEDGKAIAIVGSLDVQNIKDHAPYEVVGYITSVKEPLLETLTKLDPKTIAINYSTDDFMSDGLPHGLYLQLMEYLKGTPFADRLVSSEKILTALRGRKSPAEIEAIQGAVDEMLDIYDQVSGYVKVGMSEESVAAFIRDEIKNRGLQPAWDAESCPAVFTGPDSAGAHANPTQRVIQPGHIMNIDCGVRKNQYVSDLQRTWYFLRGGEQKAPEAVQRGFDVIREAIQKAAEAIRPGKLGWEIDKVARDYIVEAGYAEFPHGLGHQVGRKAHDGSSLLGPRWDRYKSAPFLPIEMNQVYTLEPRLNVEGHGIATIEEIIVVTENGCRFLSKPQKELICIAP